LFLLCRAGVWVTLFVYLPYRITVVVGQFPALSFPALLLCIKLCGMYRRLSTVGHVSRKGSNEPDTAPALPPSPAHSIRSSMTLYDQGDCISTERMSTTREEPVEFESEAPIVVELPKPRRPKGHYRLNDFIMQRTLGTGSFGRVHLGMLLSSTRSGTHTTLCSTK